VVRWKKPARSLDAIHRTSPSGPYTLSTLFTDLSRLLKRLVPFDFISLTLIDPKERVVRLHILETEQPICGTPRELGGLHFGSVTRNAYSDDDIEFMGQVARHVAVAVDHAQHSEAALAYEAQLVEQRLFRADLYYRLNVFPMTAPPLRERRDDIPLLVRYFVQQYARRMNRRITSIPTESMNPLARYHWPGNIRELQNFIERAVILSTGSNVAGPGARTQARTDGASAVTLEAAEREAIQRALHEAAGKVGGDSGAAARLGMKRTTLQAWKWAPGENSKIYVF
jgi:hypothetical protein